MIEGYILVAFIAFIVGAIIGGCYFDTFKIGAEWMQKTMVDKATQWLIENAKNYIVGNGGGCWYDFMQLNHDFRKAMLGEDRNENVDK